MAIARTNHLDVADLAAGLNAAIDQVSANFDRLIITRGGEPVVALIAARDLAGLEELEDAADSADLTAAIAADDGVRVSVEDVR
jgi:PHD/YefM family antitoxin component YafN of YafNO toxin-antitoxin module